MHLECQLLSIYNCLAYSLKCDFNQHFFVIILRVVVKVNFQKVPKFNINFTCKCP